MYNLSIEKRGKYLVQRNDDVFECQHIFDALDIIEPDYREEIAELAEAMFSDWGVTRLTISTNETHHTCAVAELEYEAIEVAESHPIAAIMKLFPYLLLCKAAQRLCQ
jgi:hypothetical protein